jgi:hypothetical protein
MKLWLVVIMDKTMLHEPDVGVAFIEGNELAAKAKTREMERACIEAGMARCVGRYREVERGKSYRATALIRTPDRTK